MNLEEIRRDWVTVNKDFDAVRAMWDSQASSHSYNKTLDHESNSFLKLLKNKGLLNKNNDFLDIGCGAGAYSIAISDFVRSATGIDISSKMIENGNSQVEALKKGNVQLFVDNWSEVDISNDPYHQMFDVVFAHMTPAVSCAATLEKMINVSKKYCVLCKPTRRFDPVLSNLESILGINRTDGQHDQSMMYTFSLLWQLGYCPEFFYEQQTWHVQRNYEEACAFYINRIKQHTSLSNEQIDQARNFLHSKLEDGLITETIETTITTVYWEK